MILFFVEVGFLVLVLMKREKASTNYFLGKYRIILAF